MMETHHMMGITKFCKFRQLTLSLFWNFYLFKRRRICRNHSQLLQCQTILWVHTFTFFDISFHSKVCWSSVHGRKMLDITRQMERNAHLGISDFYFVEDKGCKLDFAGTMDLERVLEIVKEKVMEQKSCRHGTLLNHFLNYLTEIYQIM